MDYDLESYKSYILSQGHFFWEVGAKVEDRIYEVINYFFVESWFGILRWCWGIFDFFYKVIDGISSRLFSSDSFAQSQSILNKLGGTNLKAGSLFAVFLMFLVFYLAYHFFMGKGNFAKEFLKFLSVILLFFFWFGRMNTPAGNMSGAQFVVTSTNHVFDEVQTQVSSAITGFSSAENIEPNDSLFNSTIRQTFYYVNTGSFDGVLGNGEAIKEEEVLWRNGQTEEDVASGIQKMGENNPYMQPTINLLFGKGMAVLAGIANLAIAGIPVLYLKTMIVVTQVLVNLLLLLFPIFFLLSFLPTMQNMIVRALKMLFGLLFTPSLIGIFLSLYMFLLSMIDRVFFSIPDIPLGYMTFGNKMLLQSVILVVLKLALTTLLFKNKYKILSFFTGKELSNNPIERKMKETTQKITNTAVGGGMAAAGFATGNPQLALSGGAKMMSHSHMGHDLAMNGRHMLAKDEHGSYQFKLKRKGNEKKVIEEQGDRQHSRKEQVSYKEPKKEESIREPVNKQALPVLRQSTPEQFPRERSITSQLKDERNKTALDVSETMTPYVDELLVQTTKIQAKVEDEREPIKLENLDSYLNQELNATIDLIEHNSIKNSITHTNQRNHEGVDSSFFEPNEMKEVNAVAFEPTEISEIKHDENYFADLQEQRR